MELVNNFRNGIQETLKLLIQQKTLRDHKRFTGSQLAKAINVKRSIIQRLIHPDPSKRVTNPRIETLQKIVDFFVADGFSISLDTFLAADKQSIDVDSQIFELSNNMQSLALYSWSKPMTEKLGIIELRVDSHSTNLVAYLADQPLPPIFKQGSIFIIDQNAKLTNGNLVAVYEQVTGKLFIKKYQYERNIVVLHSLDPLEESHSIMPTEATTYMILGVIVQVNAKT